MRNDYFKCSENLSKHLCLEIAPLCSPILPPSHKNSRYLDIFSREELQAKFKDFNTVDVNSIINIHYVQKNNKPYKEIVGQDRFGLIIASHVIEHVPNLIGWLNNIDSILLDGGIVQLAIPDKRYCFDFRRRLTEMSDIIGAYLDNRTQLPPSLIYDFYMNAHNEFINDPVALHAGNASKELIVKKEYHDIAYSFAANSLIEYKDVYANVHAWVWTPEVFVRQMKLLRANNLINLSIVDEEVVVTKHNTLEFFITFRKG